MDNQPQQADTPRTKPTKIGFPAPLLGRENYRLEVLHLQDGLLGLERPAGVVMAQHPWYPELPVLAESLGVQMRAQKPELMRLGLSPDAEPRAVFSMDPQIGGVGLLALTPEALDAGRNAFGSGLYTLRFQFLCFGGPDEDSIDCDLPLAQHISRPYSLISHQTGKRTLTQFRRIERMGRFSLWQAVTRYYRPDQLALHATECGLRIIGDHKYAHEPAVYLSQIKPKWQGDREAEPPLYDDLAAWLHELDMGNGTVLRAPLPPRLANMIRQLRKHG